MIWDLIFGWPGLATWLGGATLVNYPIFRRLQIEDVRQGERNQWGPVGVGIASTFISLFWPLAAPFVASFWLHRRRMFDGDVSVEEAKNEAAAKELAKASQADARRELERHIAELNKPDKVESEVIAAREMNDYGWATTGVSSVRSADELRVEVWSTEMLARAAGDPSLSPARKHLVLSELNRRAKGKSA